MENLNPSCKSCLIYPASLGAILTAIQLRAKGIQPYLINRTGFPGGDITETLSCIQNIPGESDWEGVPESLRTLITEASEVLSDGTHRWIVDPEEWKHLLWRIIGEHNLKIRCHATPYKIKVIDGRVQCDMMLREGHLQEKFDFIIDCSSDGHLLATHFDLPAGSGAVIHGFATGLSAGKRVEEITHIDLGNRQWVAHKRSSYNPAKPGLELDAWLETLSRQIEAGGGNLQSIPLRAYIGRSAFPENGFPLIFGHAKNANNSEQLLQLELRMASHVLSCL